MKKLLYGFAALACLWLSSCSEVDNLAGGGDTAPAVTIYSYAIPADTDEDATVNLRIMPNAVCSQFYVLAEKQADKAAFIAANGVDAYAARVVANGTQYTAEPTKILNETLAGVYAVTAVGVAADGTTGKPAEFLFNGIEWATVGAAFYSTHAIGSLAPAVVDQAGTWYKSVNLETVRYKFEATMAAWSNYKLVIKLNWNAEGALTFYNGRASTLDPAYWWLPTPFTYGSYGAVWTEVDPDPAYSGYLESTNTVYLDARSVVSAGYLVNWGNTSTIKLPAKPW